MSGIYNRDNCNMIIVQMLYFFEMVENGFPGLIDFFPGNLCSRGFIKYDNTKWISRFKWSSCKRNIYMIYLKQFVAYFQTIFILR